MMLSTFRIFLTLSLALVFSQPSLIAQQNKLPGMRVYCPHGTFDGHHHVPLPQYIQERMQERTHAGAEREACSEIVVNYSGFTPAAQAAFEYAKGIWESVLESNVPIRVNAVYENIPEGFLGSAGPNGFFHNFAGAPDNRLYPSALACAIAGFDVEPIPTESHIECNFNSSFDWYFGLDGNPPAGQFDFVSVVLHELGHGLGFTSSRAYDEDTGEGNLGFFFGGMNRIFPYDSFLRLGPNGNPLTSLANGSVQLGNAYVSDNVYAQSPLAIAANNNQIPKIYAPTIYGGGGSIAHWDDDAFPSGHPNSLMTPFIGPGEAVHDPGPGTLGLFEDMGWPICQSATDEPCTTWTDPSPTQGWTNFNTTFGGAPCDNGSGCPTFEITSFQAWASEAYVANNFIQGGTYTFGICNGSGAGSWIPDFTIIAPSGQVDAFGSTDACSITWTASESGTYLIVINEAGACGVANIIDNGFPSLTCVDGTAVCEDNGCFAPDPISDGPTELCPDEGTLLSTDELPEFPANGGIRLTFINTSTSTGFNINGAVLPFTIDNDLGGILSANGVPPLVGEYEVTLSVYEDGANIAGSICDVSSNTLLYTFLDADDPACNAVACSAPDPVSDGPTTLCPDEGTTLSTAVPPQFPEGGGIRLTFINTSTSTGFNINGAVLPFTIDNDLGGILSANGVPPLVGEYEVTLSVYEDGANIAGSICDVSSNTLIYTFLQEDDPECNPIACEAPNLVANGSLALCPGETTVLTTLTPPSVPVSGGLRLNVSDVGSIAEFNLDGVSLPFVIDNDLGGFLSANSLPPLSGQYEIRLLVYTDAQNIGGSICAASEQVLEIAFFDELHPNCVQVSCAAAPLIILEAPMHFCPDLQIVMQSIGPVEIPASGAYTIRVSDSNQSHTLTGLNPAEPMAFDGFLNGALTEPLQGPTNFVARIHEDSGDLENSVCDEAAALIIDFLAVTDQACVSTAVHSSPIGLLEIYPNPGVDRITASLSLRAERSFTLSIYNVTGKLIKRSGRYTGAGEFKQELFVGGLAPGFYQLMVQTDDARITKPFVIQR